MNSIHVCSKCGNYAGRGNLCSTCAAMIKGERDKDEAAASVKRCLTVISEGRRGSKQVLEAAGLLATMIKTRFVDETDTAVRLVTIAKEGRGGGPYNAIVALGAMEDSSHACARALKELLDDGTVERIIRAVKRRRLVIIAIIIMAALISLWLWPR